MVAPIRTLLGILSGSLLTIIIGVTAFGAWFARGWEGGRQPVTSSWQLVVPMLLLAYLAYCLLCAIFDFPRRFLLATGIVAHLGLSILLISVIVYSIGHPQDSSSAGLVAFIFTATGLASLWFAHFRSVPQPRQRYANDENNVA
jgi:hypothetical protein